MRTLKTTLSIFTLCVLFFNTSDAQAKTIVAEEVTDSNLITQSPIVPNASAGIATLTIFADPTTSSVGSSWLSYDLGTHAFITIKNISNSYIQIGNLSNIASGKTVSIGTWGNKSEHKGLWYNLEASYVSKDSAYSNRVSYSYALTDTSLITINSYIQSKDYWSNSTNCSTFAAGAWNSIVSSTDNLSAGTPNTPKNLANNIKTKWPTRYQTKYSVPYDYLVYYAQGNGAPRRSTVY